MNTRVSGAPLTWDETSQYPGIFDPGSDGDKWLLKRHESLVTGAQPDLRINDSLTEHGLVRGDFARFSSWPITDLSHVDGDIAHVFDHSTLVEIDKRVRFCRCLLGVNHYPWDREPIRVSLDEAVWAYQSDVLPEDVGTFDEPTDPLEWILIQYHFEPQWYAAKVLAHYRRAERLNEQALGSFSADHAFGLAREWMLFGETWAEANFIINHSKDALAEKRAKSGRSDGGRARATRFKDARASIISAMRPRVDKGMSPRSAARLTFEVDGLGTSTGANYALYRRHVKKGHC